jgi:uncharacterized protein YndB with AHSA1/START domain
MSIHQEISISASPSAVFKCLTDSASFEKMTGGRKADISKEVGGAASMFGGDIRAVNVEIVPGKRLVQSWRSSNWPEGAHSIVRFELKAEGKGTKLIFDQAGYPEGAQDMLSGGWHKMYWEPMAQMLAT